MASSRPLPQMHESRQSDIVSRAILGPSAQSEPTESIFEIDVAYARMCELDVLGQIYRYSVDQVRLR